MSNASLEYVTTNTQVTNKINEFISKYIELMTSINPSAEAESIKNNAYLTINGYLRNYQQGHFSDDEIITQLQTMISILNRNMSTDVNRRGGKSLKRKNKKSNKKSRKSRKSRKSK
jgi:flagellar capping protein FliD